MHGGPGVRLGDDQQALLQRPRVRLRGQRGQAARLGLVAAQDAQAGTQDRLQHLAVDQPVLAVPEEREVVVDQPAQQLDGVGDVPVRYRQPRVGQLVGQAQRLGAHLRPVFDRLAHVGQYPLEVAQQLVAVVRVAYPVDVQQHPALDQVTGDRVVRLDVGGDLDQRAQRLPSHHHQRVDQQVYRQVAGR